MSSIRSFGALFSLTVVLCLPLSCTEGGGGAGGAPETAATPASLGTVHALKCGCAIESVGHCGEYIEVEGQWVALKAPIDLGSMPFCHKDGLRARVEGRVENGVFVATAFAYEP